MISSTAKRSVGFYGRICSRILIFLFFWQTFVACNIFMSPQMLPDKVMINVPQLLKSAQWQVGIDTTVSDVDIRGVGLSVTASRWRRTTSTQSQFVGVDQQVIEYSDLSQAKQQYATLQSFEFQDSFSGDPPKGPTFTYKDMEGAASLNLNADKYRIACMNIYKADDPSAVEAVNCKGLFLYGNDLILFGITPVQNSSTYLSSDDLMTLYRAADATMLAYHTQNH